MPETDFFLTQESLILSRTLINSASSYIKGSLKVKARRNEKKLVDGLALEGHFDSKLELIEFKKRIKVNKVSGKINLIGHFNGFYDIEKEKLFNKDAVGRISSQQASLEQFKLFDSLLDFKYSQDIFEVRNALLKKANKEYLNLSGKIDLAKITESLLFDVSLSQVEIQDLLEFFGSKGDAYTFLGLSNKLKLKIDFSPFHLKLQGPLEIKDFKLPDLAKKVKNRKQTVCDFNLELDISDKHLSFSENNKGFCYFQAKEKKLPREKVGDLKITGNVEFSKGFDLDFSSKQMDYQFISTFLPVLLSGQGRIDLNLSEKDDKVKTKILYSGHNFFVANFALGKSSGDLTLIDDHLEITNWSAFAEFGKVSGGGFLDFSKDTFSIKIESDEVKDSGISFLRKELFSENSNCFFCKKTQSKFEWRS